MAKIVVKFPTWQVVEHLWDRVYVVQTLDNVVHLICLDENENPIIQQEEPT